MGEATTQPDALITPLLPKDQYRPLENLRSMLYFIVREKLDEQILRQSLETLIREHLPVLGARLKPSGGNNALEYHLTQSFPDGHILFGWSNSSISSSFAHVTLLNGPVQEGTAITWGTPTIELEKLWIPTDWPLERKYEQPDCPLLLVHITHYTDATVVSTSLPHAVADQMGYASVIEAWLAVAQGKAPTPFLQVPRSIFETSSKFSEEDLRAKGNYRLKSMLERVGVIVSHAMELVWEQKEERRLLFLSEQSVSRLREKYSLAVQADYGPESPSLTTSDVITGIITKLRYLNLKKPTFLSLSGTVNARGRHPALPLGQPFLHNALGYSDARFRICPETTAAEIAYQNRLAVNEAVKLDSIERCFAVHAGVFQGGYSPHIGEPGDTTFAVTNWMGAWRNIDFTVASPRKSSTWFDSAISAEAVRDGTVRSPSMIILGISMERSISVLRFSTQIMCRAEGGYWCDFTCSKNNMEAIDRLVEGDPMLETI